MTVGQYLSQATLLLDKAKIESARLDVLVLLEDTLDKNRAHLLAHPELELSDAQLTHLDRALARRKRHVPLAYIRGKAEFYGRNFVVNEHVLVPRPETESIIELVKTLHLPAGSHVLDLGCGSGAIGVTTALELPELDIILSDIDTDALAVAHKNAQRHNASVQYMQADLLGDTPKHYDCILANLPYVPEGYPINTAATYEPKLALFAGSDGLDLYRRLFAVPQNARPAYIITEALEPQHQPLAAIAKTARYSLARSSGLAQLFVRSD
ncbi:MAG TPA: peptide chain release factor N(5)-glutamine methyltransferase [Candidatus Saccharimonadales bacterium]